MCKKFYKFYIINIYKVNLLDNYQFEISSYEIFFLQNIETRKQYLIQINIINI